jgi:putative membrane protein
MSKLLYALVITVAVFLGLSFTYMNNQSVQINYLSFSREVNLTVLLLCTLLLGVLLGLSASISSSMKSRRNISRLKRQLKSQESAGI